MRKEALLCLSLMLTQSYAFASSETDNTLKQAEVHALAQKGYTVKGIVKDQLGEPLGGVSIVVKGTTVGTTTDLDGNFTLNVPGNNVTLSFSFIGFKSQEVSLKGQTDLNIVLSEDAEMLDEVVVVGYGSMKRSDVATAISSVKPEDMNLAGANSRDVRQLLDGKVAGLSITRTNGSNPNNGVAVQMRGVVSVNGDIAPLVVIDGIPGGNLDLLRSEDIESIDVLKDGSAAAIYGSRANAGVILITTKRGSKGKTSVDYSTYLTHYWGIERPDFMDATEWRSAMGKFNNPSYMTDRGSDTDWFDTLLNSGNASHSHNLSISGGGESTLYRASLYYSNLEGIGKATDREQYGGRMSLETKALNNMLTFQTNMSLNYGNMNLLGGDGEWESALRSNPTNPVYNEDGTYYEDYAKDENKVARLDQQQYDKQQTTSSFDGKLIFEPIKDLKGSVFVSYTRDDYKERRFYDVDSRISYNSYNSGGYAWKKSYMKTTRTLEPTIEYTKTFLDNHKINAIAGYSYQYQVYEQLEAN
ncbi:SusC/RagA family TonB-linked outer membrane protein [Parabacteroides johnsonii]|nr:SusC/RagA family TonB-linked outer membrane protein [Parabacteroides johnsonii]